MKQVVITGAGGFLGGNLVIAFAQAGYRVWAGDVAPPDPALQRAWEETGGSVEVVRLDVCQDQDWNHLPRTGVNAVVHAAAVTSGLTDENPALTTRVNVGGTVQALEWARRTGVDRFVYISSSAVYRGVTSDGPLKEDLPLAPTTVYGRTKWASEGFVNLYGDVMDSVTSIARLPSLFGPWERPNRYRQLTSPVHQLIAGGLEKGRVRAASLQGGKRDYTPAEAVAGALVQLVALPVPPRLLNLSTGCFVGWEELKSVLEVLLDADFVLGDDPEIADVVLTPTSGEQPMDTGRMTQAGIDLAPSFPEGLERTVEWFKSYYQD